MYKEILKGTGRGGVPIESVIPRLRIDFWELIFRMGIWIGDKVSGTQSA